MHHEWDSGPRDDSIEQGLVEVRALMTDVLESSSLRPMAEDFKAVVGGGKMLRSRLALRLGAAGGAPYTQVTRTAAVVEMIHAASLLHDDVIDRAQVRRGAPAVWVEKGIAGAVLLGDLLVSRAIGLMAETEGGRLVPLLVKQTAEMCDAVARQEILLRGRTPDWDTCVDIARRKTGSLFAFAACACGDGGDEALRTALLEAGYGAGTAYQLADDILDAYGDPVSAGKSLGTDAAGEKITAASSFRGNAAFDPTVFIDRLCESSARALAAWPSIQAAWQVFLGRDLRPSISRFVEQFAAEVAV
jgi:geranylgeranyl pyrophosphate synthase